MRLGLQGIPSVHLLIPEVASSYTNTFPLTISWLRSRSCGRRKQWARCPAKQASKMINASFVVSMCPRHVGTHAGAFPVFIAQTPKVRVDKRSVVAQRVKILFFGEQAAMYAGNSNWRRYGSVWQGEHICVIDDRVEYKGKLERGLPSD